MSEKTLVLGLGNVLLSDEAIGAVAVQRLEAEHASHPSLELIDGGTLSFTLALPIAECDRLIVIDAAELGEQPGHIRVFEDEAMDRQLGAHAKSVHEVSLSDLMDIARLTDTLPRRRALIGVEPALVDWGEHLTPEVEKALPEVLAQVHALIRRWNLEAESRPASPG